MPTTNGVIVVPPDSTGKNLQTFSNTVSAQTVHAEAVVLVRTSDNTEIGTSGQPVRIDPTGTTAQPVTQSGAPWSDTLAPTTSGGLTTFFNGAVTNTAVAVKASAGQVYSWMLFNPSGAVAYLQVFNVAAAGVTVGTTAPLFSIPVQAGTQVPFSTDIGIAFGTAISVAATTTPTGSSAPGTAMVVNIFYA